MPVDRSNRRPAGRHLVDDADGGVAPAVQVLRQFRQVFNAVRTHFHDVERGTGIGGAQLWALGVIAARPGIGVGQLAQAMDVHQATASNLVRGLLEARLVARERHPEDRRAVCLRLLSEGSELLARAPGPFEGVLPAALARLDPDTLARLRADLDALLALLEVDRRAAGIPLADL
jgi:DNA-binding MarR family transcriptional regulator